MSVTIYRDDLPRLGLVVLVALLAWGLLGVVLYAGGCFTR